MRFLYAVPVALACAFVGCKGGGEAAPAEGEGETAQAACACGDTECKCEKCVGGKEDAECTCAAK